MNNYVICCRSVDDGEFGKSVGDISYLQIPDDVTSPTPKHSMSNVQTFMKAIIDQAKNSDNVLDIVLMVHGYNIDETEAYQRQLLVQRGLSKRDVPCVVIGFDWPTASNIALYLYDRMEAHESAQKMAMGCILPFAMFQQPDCMINVHIVAHSMGAYVTREAFRTIDKIRMSNLPDWKVSQLVLVAADLAASSFVNDDADMISMFNHSGRLTNYYNGYDIPLSVSNAKRLGTSPRVGKTGMPVELNSNLKAVDIDCSLRYHHSKSVGVQIISQSHVWYFTDPKWLDDLAYTIHGVIDRNLINTRIKVGNNDFQLKEH